MDRRISGSMLHDLVRCERRVHLDLHGDQTARDPVSPFVKMLWRAGSVHEDEVVARLADEGADLRSATPGERLRETHAAMAAQVPLIVGGEIAVDDLVGRPDLLRHVRDGLYLPGDVKLGAAPEGEEGGRARRLAYGLQLALYADALDRLGALAPGDPFIVDGRGDEVDYPLEAPVGTSPEPLVARYAAAAATARSIVAGARATAPALAAQCKLCHWKSVCRAEIAASDDLTRIPQLGRSLRDRLVDRFPTVTALADEAVNLRDGAGT